MTVPPLFCRPRRDGESIRGGLIALDLNRRIIIHARGLVNTSYAKAIRAWRKALFAEQLPDQSKFGTDTDRIATTRGEGRSCSYSGPASERMSKSMSMRMKGGFACRRADAENS